MVILFLTAIGTQPIADRQLIIWAQFLLPIGLLPIGSFRC